MSPSQILGLVMTLMLFAIGHLGAAIWFASRISTQVANMITDIGQLSTDVKAFVKNETRIALLEQRLTALELKPRYSRPSTGD